MRDICAWLRALVLAWAGGRAEPHAAAATGAHTDETHTAHGTGHSAQPDTCRSTHRDIPYRFPQYMFSLPPQRTQHIPHGLLLFGFFSHGIGPEGLRHTGCPLASSEDRARAFVFYLSSFAAAARWSMYSSALSYTSSHSSSFAHCWQKAITWVGFGFRCSRLIPTLRLGFGSGGRQV